MVLPTDKHGNQIRRVLTACEVRRLDGESLLIVIGYVETDEQLENPERKQFQTMVYASDALELAETLKRAATAALAPKSLNNVQ